MAITLCGDDGAGRPVSLVRLFGLRHGGTPALSTRMASILTIQWAALAGRESVLNRPGIAALWLPLEVIEAPGQPIRKLDVERQKEFSSGGLVPGRNSGSTPNSRHSPKSVRCPHTAFCVGFGVPWAGIENYLRKFGRMESQADSGRISGLNR